MESNLEAFLKGLQFRWMQPSTKYPKGFGRFNQLLNMVGLSFDQLNTKIRVSADTKKQEVKEACRMPRMASYPIGLIINQIVAEMHSDQAYLNVGVWQGFSLIAGIAGHPHKICIGLDNFSMWGGPREAFLERFEQWKGASHYFYEIDYKQYLLNQHQTPLGFYFYDGDHSYDHQLNGLKIAEPFFAKNCVIMVDDTNWEEPRQATYDFMKNSSNSYEVIMDQLTTSDLVAQRQSAMHPTYWNGLLLIRKTN